MNQTSEQRETRKLLPNRRSVAVAVAVAGLLVPALSAGVTGAAIDHGGKSVLVATAKNAKFGTILVSGTTLYTLRPSKTACTAACLKVWPELVLPAGVTKASAGSGVSPSKLGTVTRFGGVRQVTYAGTALYRFSGDKAAGQVHGNVTDTWGTWSTVVTVKPVASGGGSGTTSTTSAGTGGVAF